MPHINLLYEQLILASGSQSRQMILEAFGFRFDTQPADIEEIISADQSPTANALRLAEEKANYTNMKLTHTLSPLENPLQIRVARRTIARLSTELSSRSAEE